MSGRTTILNAQAVSRISFAQAQEAFFRHCKLKNLRKTTMTYYAENLRYFKSRVNIRYIDDITQDVIDEFILFELDSGKKSVSLNTRIRGLRVFFNFCVERDYLKPLSLKLMRTDEEIKEPYTKAELSKLLQRPKSNRWAEWRSWAVINYLLSTGNRAGTVINLHVDDIDFKNMTIHLRTVKNRKQQIVPLSPALSDALETYLKTWEWTPDNYLFPTNEGKQLQLRSLQSSVARYNISRGVTKTSVHLFRHTFAKDFILAGGGMAQLQFLLGHSTLEMTRHSIYFCVGALESLIKATVPKNTSKIWKNQCFM